LVRDLASGKTIPAKPVSGKGVFHKKSEINFLKKIACMDDFEEVDRKARAFYFPPHEPAYYELQKHRFYITPKPY